MLQALPLFYNAGSDFIAKVASNLTHYLFCEAEYVVQSGNWYVLIHDPTPHAIFILCNSNISYVVLNSNTMDAATQERHPVRCIARRAASD
jgi:lipocalin